MIARTGRSASRSTRPIISCSCRWKTPVRVPSAISVRTSSSVTVSAGWTSLPSRRSTNRLDVSSSQTAGVLIREIRSMVGATSAATRSGARSARCLGTSSPMISER